MESSIKSRRIWPAHCLGVCDRSFDEDGIGGKYFDVPAAVFSKDATIFGGSDDDGDNVRLLAVDDDDDDDAAEIKWSQVSTFYCVVLQTGERNRKYTHDDDSSLFQILHQQKQQ